MNCARFNEATLEGRRHRTDIAGSNPSGIKIPQGNSVVPVRRECWASARAAKFFGGPTPALGAEIASRTEPDSFLNVCAKVGLPRLLQRTVAHENSNVAGKRRGALYRGRVASPCKPGGTDGAGERGQRPPDNVARRRDSLLSSFRRPTFPLYLPAHTTGRNDAVLTSFARSWYPCIRVRSSRTPSPVAAANSRLRQTFTFVGQRGRSHSGCCSASS